MATHNREIADLFNELADLLEIEGANPFRVRAYRNAALTINNLTHNVADMVDQGEDLTALSGIGAELDEKIKTIVQTGKLPMLDDIKKRVPGELAEMLKVQGLGPKKVRVLYDELNIKNFQDLERAARAKKIRQLKGFGDKTEKLCLDAVQKIKVSEKRFLLADVDEIAEELVEYLKSIPGVSDVAVAGSFRRRKETVGDLDILVTNKKGTEVINNFVQFPKIDKIISQGDTRSTVRLNSGLQVDLRVVPKKSYGAAMHYFTGSKAHNVALRKMAVEKGWKFNEYGVFEEGKCIGGKTEKEVYGLFGMDYVEPELRENRGELEAALSHQLPKLIELNGIKGDLHCHTTETDGMNTLEEMVEAAIALGYEYMAITDHTKHLTVANGQDEKRLLTQIKKIDALNATLKNFRVLKSAEVDILEDGRLDMADEVLKELDLTVCSVHYKFDLSRKKQTDRILRAMDNPNFTILGHATSRLLNRREGVDIDLERILRHAAEHGHFVELNAQPRRMDLNDTQCQLAKELGVKIVISTDSHSIKQLENMRFGVGIARRAWLEADDVVNTWELSDLLKAL